MADEIQNTGIQFEDIVPWVDDHGDTGLSARLKLKRNFDKIKAWMDANHIDVDAVKEIIEEYGVELFLSKLNDDTAVGFITFLQGLQVGNQFVSGLLGNGGVFRRDADGKVYIEADKLYVRMKAYFDNVEIKDYEHTSGNRIASKAGLKCVKVEAYNTDNELIEENPQTEPAGTSYYRLYFRAKDGEDTIDNNFVVGDQAFCDKTTFDNNVLAHHRYWRLVVGKNSTLQDDEEFGYIDLSASDKESGSAVPLAGDDVSQLGNRTNVERQGAIIEFVGGENAPAYQIYQGINTYSLSGKCKIDIGFDSQTGLARMNVAGNFRFGSPVNTGSYIKYDSQANQGKGQLDIKAHVEFTNSDEELNEIVQGHQKKYDDDIANLESVTEDLQRQIDGAIETWFMTGVPTLQNAPANEWTTDDEKDKHIGDLYYDKATNHGYRFMYDNEEEAYLWTILTDEDVIEALRLAAQAQETADGKRTVYSVWDAWMKNNVNTLEVGDLFIPTANTTQGGVTYKAKKVYKCTAEGSATFEEIAYTDDSAFNGYINAFLNGTGASGDSAIAAAIQKAIAGALGSGTVVAGGLLLTSLIGMRQYNGTGDKSDVSNYTTWAGISGQYNTNVLGGGMAAWYGGGMVDKETLTTQQIAQGWDALRWAKGVDRFDGSGYRADGNISWNENGALTIKNITTLSDSNNNNILNELATFNSAFTFGTSGQGSTTALYITPNVPFESLYIGTSNANKKEVATQEWVGNNYVSTAFFRQLFRAFKPNETAEQADVEVEPNTIDNTISNIKAMVGLWTEQYISALGRGADGGGGGQGDVTWALLASTATGGRTIDISYLANALSGYVTSTSLANTLSSYATQSWVTNQGYALQTSVDALEFLNSVSAQNNKVTLTTNKNNSTILDFTHEHVWSEILDKPSTLQGYGIFDTYIGNGVISINGVQITPLVLDDITDKDTSLSYGTRSTIASVGSKDIHVTMPAAYSLPTASSNALGGVQIGFTTDAANRNYAVLLSGNKAYVNVPWTDTVYTHPSGGADTTISAANGRVLSAITVNGLGHTTSVSYKALTMADMPSDMKFFNTIANVNDGIIRFAGHNITAQDVDFSHEHTWADILDKPASLAGFGIDKNDPLLKENYLTIEFFERLFNAYNGENIVHANSTSTIDSIKAMFGFWTEQYISALGLGDDGETGSFNESQMWNALGTSISVKRIATTYLENATRFNAVTGGDNHINLSGVGVTSTALDLTHEHSWWEILDKPSSLQGYGIYDTYIEGTTVYIGGAHIDVVPSGSVDLTGYAKESWVSANYQVKGNYLTSADLSGYLPKVGGIMTGDISRRMTADTSNYENAIKWINFSAGKTIAAIGYHNTVQKIYLNPVGSSEIYNDAVGKYSLVIGNNTLTYNTKEIATQEWVTGHAVRKLDWWSSGDSHSVDSLTSGTTFAYTSHGAPTTGTIVAFSCTNNGYPLQIQGSYSGEGLYFRNYNGDNGTWKTWRSIIHSGNIGSQTVSNSDMVDGYHASSFAFVGSHNNLTASGNEFTTAASGQAGSYWINYRTAGGMNGAITIYTLGNGNGGRAALDASNITANGLLNSVSNGVTIQVGAQNSSWAHITNNANVAFYFNNSICTDGHLYPYANNTYSLGTSSNYWAGAYIADINIGSNRYYGDGAYGINMNNSDLIGCNSIRTMDLSDDYTEGLLFARTNGNWDSFRAADSNFYFQYNNGNSMMQMNTDGIYLYTGWLRTYGATGWYNQSYGGGWYMQDSTWIRSYGGKYVYVDSYFQGVHVWAGSGGGADSNYALHVNGVGYFSSGVYSDGYVSALSDVRHKEIVGNTKLTVEQIANMRSVLFRWNDGKHDNGLYVGSIAQDWENVLPQVVGIEDNAEQTRSLQYGVAALVSAITTARKVVDHEKRITELEKERDTWKEAYSFIKNAYEELKLKIA